MRDKRMSFYKELNDVKLDIREFEEVSLSNHEQKRILKQVKRKISSRNPKKQWLGIGTAAGVIALSISLSSNGVIASIPFIGDVIEKYISSTEKLDYASYKTAIGETAENELGKLTLNEVMMDDKLLILSATFEPAEHVDFDYQTYLGPSVKINGKDYTFMAGGQSIELNKSMFTIYNDITLSEAIDTENIHLEISYDKLDRTAIEQPWTFDVNVLQARLLQEKKVFEMNKTITLTNGETVTIQRVVTTPISTTVYYDLSKSSRVNIRFIIQSEDGKTERFSESFNSNDHVVSFARFMRFTFEADKKYFLLAYDSEDNQLNELPIPIN
jgi:hypothetical protein